ncbi:RNA polymerase sigma-70 factor [Phocaeicola oris]|uniref:RNA polymerase sigma-70 factor n=1 Tax=Phocaeicola oris TaxID=2896850 RepID=UPI00234F9F8C|nr:RNA polymerase sigma-70 factor [Phocaeicola oris]MCE2617384.1 RNA polymerase sigma-70 factor [Phocaeicola oris]
MSIVGKFNMNVTILPIESLILQKISLIYDAPIANNQVMQEEKANTFELFYRKYHSRFLNYAFFFVKDNAVAEDIVHDTLLYSWEHRDKLNYSSIETLNYILKSVKNGCINYLKRLKLTSDLKEINQMDDWEISIRLRTLEDVEYERVFTAEIMDIVNKSLEDLPPRTRHIFYLYRIELKSRKEIAEQYHVSLQNIDYHIHKAEQFLRLRLKDYMPLILLLIS